MRQVNSQLFQPPLWRADGSTGDIKQEIDVSALTANADANLVISGFSINIGDGALATTVYGKLDASEQLLISSITSDTVKANNDGSYYSVPRSGATNTNQRTFNVKLTKPMGATITKVTVELHDSAGTLLQVVQQDQAPGTGGVTLVNDLPTSATLKVRATFLDPASDIGGTPPLIGDLSYRFIVKANDTEDNEITGEKDAPGKRSLWRMPDGFARYGERDKDGDNWAARGTYNWIQANASLVREIDDISGEHGINIGHTTHARGTDIDMYHFYRFPGAVSGTDNYNRLTQDLLAAFGTLEQNPSQAATDAYNRVTTWISASRAGLTDLESQVAVKKLIYCDGMATQGLPAGWCNTLLRQGTAARNLAGQPQQVLNFSMNTYTNAKLDKRNDHHNHIHITLDPAQINE